MKILNARAQMDDSRARRHGIAKTRVHFFLSKESILENLQNRRGRPVKALRALLPEALIMVGRDAAEAKGARWSQRAGCACGCSPGFILETKDNMDIFVDYAEVAQG